jgi:hypothetical protein
MIELSNTKYGTKRKAIVAGFAQWDHLNTHVEILFYVQLLTNSGSLLDDKSLNQNRAVVYSLSNYNLVDSFFNPVESDGVGEYNYFFNVVSNPQGKTIIDILLLLGQKLNERGIFD